MARPCKLTPENNKKLGTVLFWDFHILLLPMLPESNTRHSTTGTRNEEIQNLENKLSSVNLFKS